MKQFNTITGAALLNKPLIQQEFVIADLMPKGLHLLAGAPKAGKSYLSLWLSLQVAKGEDVWGSTVAQGDALYLCFEDNEARIQNRLYEITDEAPDSLHFCVELAKLGGELESKVTTFVLDHPNTKLVIIDTLQMVRSITRDSSYANDYAELSQLKALADELGIAILMIHHFRKQKDGDTFQQISGSTGLQGAVDTMFTLSKLTRDSDRAILKCVGRDIEARELSLVRDQDNIWQKKEDSLPNRTIEQTRFVQAVQSFMADKHYFCGTPTELSTLLSAESADNFSNRIISKNFTLLAKNLETVGIMGSCHRSNGQRVVEIICESVDSDVKTAV